MPSAKSIVELFEAMIQELGRQPTMDELAERTGVPLEQLKRDIEVRYLEAHAKIEAFERKARRRATVLAGRPDDPK